MERARRILIASALMLASARCTWISQDTSSGTVRHEFALAPERAAACFARNAEAHSSALVAEVRPPDARGHVNVVVRVRNGVTYATAEIRPTGQRAEGTIMLNVTTPRGTRELVRTLVEGC